MKKYATMTDVPEAKSMALNILGNETQYQAIYNPKDETVYSVMGKNYQIVQHKDAIAAVEEAMTKNKYFGDYTKSIQMLHPNGGRVKATFNFPDTKIEIAKGDMVNPSIHLYNSYDGLLRLNLAFGAFRLICANGLVIGQTLYKTVKKHTTNLDMKSIGNALEDSMKIYEIQTKQWKDWNGRILKEADMEKHLEKLGLNKKESENILNVTEKGSGVMLPNPNIVGQKKEMSMWQFYNILTQFITHDVKKVNRQETLYGNLSKIL